MSSLVESRHDGDCRSTRSTTMSGARHGRTSSRTFVTGSTGGHVGSSSMSTQLNDISGPSSLIFYDDASSLPRLSLKSDGGDVCDVTCHVIDDAHLQTGSRNPRSTEDSGGSGEVRSRSAETSMNNVDTRTSSDLRSSDDCYLLTGGVVGLATSELSADSDRMKTVRGVEPLHKCPAAVENLMLKQESLSQCDDVKLENYIDDACPDDVDFKRSAIASTSPSLNHVVSSTCSAAKHNQWPSSTGTRAVLA